MASPASAHGVSAPAVLVNGDATTPVLRLVAAPGQLGDLFTVETDVGSFLVEIDGGGDFIFKSGSGSGYLAVFSQSAQDSHEFSTTTGYAFDKGGVRLAGITASGALFTARHSAPPDADLATGDAAIWFDQTNGAAKLMVKAKQANGTVKTGQLALA